MTQPTTLIRTNLHDMLVAGIREMVIAGALRPGDKIPEQALCQRWCSGRCEQDVFWIMRVETSG